MRFPATPICDVFVSGSNRGPSIHVRKAKTSYPRPILLDDRSDSVAHLFLYCSDASLCIITAAHRFITITVVLRWTMFQCASLFRPVFSRAVGSGKDAGTVAPCLNLFFSLPDSLYNYIVNGIDMIFASLSSAVIYPFLLHPNLYTYANLQSTIPASGVQSIDTSPRHCD